ncbi:MAG: hypothetical protein Q7U08_00970, partial [Flavobacteriaceae bacterium]|nr:hypothetical protein [Flavobacteriaceae bacterium]
MKITTPKFSKKLLALLFLVIGSNVSDAQVTGNPMIYIYYPGSPDPIVFGSTINVSSNEIEITIKNFPTLGNPSLT